MFNFATLWTVARQTPQSMGFSRQEYWSGSPCPPPGDLPDPGIELVSLMSPALAGGLFTTQGHLGSRKAKMFPLWLPQKRQRWQVWLPPWLTAAAPIGGSDGYSSICGSALGAAPGVYGCTETPRPQTCSQWCFLVNWLTLCSHCPAPFMHPLN